LRIRILTFRRNQKETLTQNYRRLGLAVQLNHVSGGVEKTAASIAETAAKSSKAEDPLAINSKLPTTITPGEARIERDPETGAILRVIEDPNSKPNPLNDPLNDLEESDPEEWQGFDNPKLPKKLANTPVISELEEVASRGIRKAPRHPSAREGEWIETLVSKYGGDYARMARDMKLNPMQQSEGNIKKRVKRWRETQ